MQKIEIYSAHGELQGHVSPARAAAMIGDGDALPVRNRAGEVIAIQRALGRAAILSPAAITAREAERAADGERYARAKVRWWPMIGAPALRHAQ